MMRGRAVRKRFAAVFARLRTAREQRRRWRFCSPWPVERTRQSGRDDWRRCRPASCFKGRGGEPNSARLIARTHQQQVQADDAAHLLDLRRRPGKSARCSPACWARKAIASRPPPAPRRPWPPLRVLSSISIISLDVMMPGEDGFSFAARLRTGPDLARVPILMLTARSEAEDRVRGLETGADDYLGKPCEPRELTLRIASILRRAPPRAIAAPPTFVRFGSSASILAAANCASATSSG